MFESEQSAFLFGNPSNNHILTIEKKNYRYIWIAEKILFLITSLRIYLLSAVSLSPHTFLLSLAFTFLDLASCSEFNPVDDKNILWKHSQIYVNLSLSIIYKIETVGKRGSGRSVLAAWHDDILKKKLKFLQMKTFYIYICV